MRLYRTLTIPVLLLCAQVAFTQNLTVEGKVKIDGERLEFSDLNIKNIFIGAGVAPNTVSNIFNGHSNVAIGHTAMRNNVLGQQNLAIGLEALFTNTSGFGNVAIGNNSLSLNDFGNNNTAVGRSAFTTGRAFVNSTAIGFNAQVSATGQIRIGNSAVNSIGGFEPWTNISDKRLKKNVKSDIPGLEFITQLRPVSYHLDMESIAKWQETPDSLRDFKGEAMKGSIRYSGFLAQEVEATAQAIGYDFSGVDAPKNRGDRYGLRYSQFVVPLVKAVQELEVERQQSEERIAQLEREVEELKNLLLKTQEVELRSNNKQAVLQQNHPNPFDDLTTIDYFIPDGFRQATIRIADSNGKLVKDITINESGVGQIQLNSSELNNGNYLYYLILDGQLAVSKQMIKSNNQ